MILFAGQVSTQNVETKANGAKGPTDLEILNEFNQTQRLKANVATFGNNKMTQDCSNAYDLSLDYLNKVVVMVKAP
ncbi:hypothetical protein PTKIN_Ptkin04bG0065700 [Pterospermum kingtungense]